MSIFTNFVLGFFIAFVGVFPPGLLNMTVAKISIKQGRKAALLFNFGVCITVLVQTFVALIFARYLDRHPEVVDILQKVALGIFFSLTVYFFFFAKDSRRDVRHDVGYSKSNRFFYGILMAILNILPLPYWVYCSISFAAFGWFSFEQGPLWAAVISSGIGTFAMLLIYARYFRKMNDNKLFKLNMNYVIGFVTAAIAVVTAIKIFQHV